jgi:hypothetical protein
MSATDDLRLAWLAHCQGQATRRDALLTLAVAAGEPEGAAWVGAVRDFLVKEHPGHLFDGFYQLDEALADRRVIAGLNRLRLSFPPARVSYLVRRSEVVRSPYTRRRTSVGLLLDDLLGPLKRSKTQASEKPTTNRQFSEGAEPLNVSDADAANSIHVFYLNVLLGVAALCAVVLQESQDDKRAA